MSAYEYIESQGWNFFVVPVQATLVIMAWKGTNIIAIVDDDLREMYQDLAEEIEEQLGSATSPSPPPTTDS